MILIKSRLNAGADLLGSISFVLLFMLDLHFAEQPLSPYKDKVGKSSTNEVYTEKMNTGKLGFILNLVPK